MKIALVYDRVNKWGGAERVLLALHSIFPRAPLYTSVYDEKNASWAKVFKVKPSFLQRIPIARRNHEIFAPLMPLAFESLNFSEFDLVISITSEAAKGIRTPPGVAHICICLTPTRYLWSGHREYFKNPVFKFLLLPWLWYIKKWDIIASQRPDSYVAISETVKERIKKYYKRDAVVIYPSVCLPEKLSKKLDKRLATGDPYFLFVSRLSKLVPYKKTELVIKTANRLKLRLLVIGQGRDEEYFKQLAGDTVTFLGKVTDEELFVYYKHAQALIFPAEEDFGLVMVEAQLMGTPVIAYRAGGAVEIIKEGKTGVFFDKQTISSLSSVLKTFRKSRYNRKDCIVNAKRFSFYTFEKEILSAVASTVHI